jgi:signal transduction histidine kinase
MKLVGTATAKAREPEEKTKLRALVVEDNSADAELVLRELRRGGFEVTSEEVQTAEQFRRHIRKNVPQVVLADYNLGQWRGMETLEIMREEGVEAPLILVSGALGDVTAVECIKQGATDYVLKGTLARLPSTVRRALQEKRLTEERKQAVTALAKKAEALEISNQELEQFAYVASHDLQEPLRMVASYTQLLAERYKGQLDEQAEKYIGYAVEGATRMQALIRDLLAFSRAGRPGTEMENTDCNLVVEGALKNLQAAVHESGAMVTHGELPTVWGNAAQLQQLFQNLIGNAIKFRRAEAPLVQIAVEQRGYEWWFTLRDNGIGIAAEYASEVFIIFKRLHTRTEYTGNGIGLSICKKIVELHGGKIWLEAHEGPGTTFKFTLRAALQEPALPVPEKTENTYENHSASVVG